MTKAGVDPVVRKRIVGHKDGKNIHDGYTQVDIQTMKTAVDLIP